MWQRPARSLNAVLQRWRQRQRRVEETALVVAGCVVLLRLTGWLQPLEWFAFDQGFRLRGSAAPDHRVVVVSIDEQDLQQIGEWPIPDQVMADLLRQLETYQPRAIGLDIYRDLPVGPGRRDLTVMFETMPNLIGIETLADQRNIQVDGPASLKAKKQVGFNNVVLDADGVVRRGLLYWTSNGEAHMSLALQLALIYLESEEITPEPAPHNPTYLQLGQTAFPLLRPYDGAYVKADMGGYQFLANFRGPGSIQTVGLSQVLAGEVDPELLRDRVVLIGSTAVSLKDFFKTPFSRVAGIGSISGVELQADFTSQIISAALEGRPLILPLPTWADWLWILSFAYGGAYLSWRVRSLLKTALGTAALAVVAIGTGYGAFLLAGWWFPIVPPLLALTGSAAATMGQILQQEEKLKKSKAFLSSVINTIPDPIFVKDRQYRWIVLNDAYCQLIGYPLETLLERSALDFFPPEEAETFQQLDEEVFHTGLAQEHEERFTNAKGHTYLIATKRSLHRDSAGNVFLVGVIRDITDRKRLENELRQTASDLLRSNNELRMAEGRLRQLAYHDALTGLPNREMFRQRFEQALGWADRNQRLVALLFIDLDGFKQINDTLGHDVGDQLLQAVARRLTGCLRSSDVVARLGGDEFTVLLPAIPTAQDASRVAEKILATLSQSFMFSDREVAVTASVGISIYPLHSQDADELMKQADIAMYQSKEAGKNCYAVGALDVRIQDRL